MAALLSSCHDCLAGNSAVAVRDAHKGTRPELFVASKQTNTVHVFDALTGAPLRTVGSGRGNGPGQMRTPVGLALREARELTEEGSRRVAYLYVSDQHNHRVQVFNADSGEFVMSIGAGEGMILLYSNVVMSLVHKSKLYLYPYLAIINSTTYSLTAAPCQPCCLTFLLR